MIDQQTPLNSSDASNRFINYLRHPAEQLLDFDAATSSAGLVAIAYAGVGMDASVRTFVREFIRSPQRSQIPVLAAALASERGPRFNKKTRETLIYGLENLDVS